MRKVMTILAVAALSASTAFAEEKLDTSTGDKEVIQSPPQSKLCLDSLVATVTCGVVLTCVGGLCKGGSSSSSPASPSSPSSPASPSS